MLLLALSGSMIAQTKTLVTPYGEKVTIIPGAGTADNGLTATSGKVQMGGALTKPTTITTDAANKLEIKSNGTTAAPVSAIKIVDGNQVDGAILTSDANGAASWVPTVSSKVLLLYSGNTPTSSPAFNTYVDVAFDYKKIGASGATYNDDGLGSLKITKSGVYSLTFSAMTYGNYNVQDGFVYMVLNGALGAVSDYYAPAGGHYEVLINWIVSLNAGDVLKIRHTNSQDPAPTQLQYPALSLEKLY
jgi:hypothetical protein